MIVTTRWKRVPVFAGALLALVVVSPAAAATGPHTLASDTQFFVRHPDKGAIQQIGDLRAAGSKADANQLSAMLNTPQAVWVTAGAPKTAAQQVRQILSQAADKGTVPVFVLYNIPYRDCAQYSAGGAKTTAEYEAWIDAVAAAIGNQKAVILLEPDSLGIIPWYQQFMGTPDVQPGYEWCQPTVPDTVADVDKPTPENRFAQLNYAVDALEARPNTSVYLDGTHSNWLGSGDLANRLISAGVDKAQGFFLNVSNFELDSHLVKYGTWTSRCIAEIHRDSWWHAAWCPSQYYPADPNDFSTWHLTDEAIAWFPAGTAHFVIDSSRNGQGPWIAPSDHPAGDPQTWCNPPDRGLGSTPTANTGVPLLDAFVWAKTPGESDGACYRWTSGPQDPVRQMIDPAAGAWFPEMALELVHNAQPAIPTDRPTPAW